MHLSSRNRKGDKIRFPTRCALEYHFHVPEDDLKRLEAFELENDVTFGHSWSV